jgi:hypothetical protein
VFGVLCALLVAAAWTRMGPAGARLVYRGDFEYYPEPPDSSVVVTPPFELTGRASSLEVAVSTDLDNAWVYFNYALIEQRTGRAVEFGREVGYYHGTYSDLDDGEFRRVDYLEGSRDDAARVPTVPAGRYVLRIAPEGPVPVRYGLRVRRDAPAWDFFAVALLLLLAPPAFASLRGTRLSLISIAGADRPRR